MKKLLFISYLLMSALGMVAKSQPFCIHKDDIVRISVMSDKSSVVNSALEILAKDLKNVLNCNLKYEPGEADIILGTLNENLKKYCGRNEIRFLCESKEGFLIKVLPSGILLVVGSDNHGTAYGLLEVSRLMGVSPWEWWADVTPRKKQQFEIPAGFSDLQAPSVEYRGIFINDEDWGLMPWSSKTMEPGNEIGVIGPKTTERIFELLLRLRANTYWPPMHECSEPFFLTPGNKEVAEKYGIYIGGSHCEPMASSTAVEWDRRGVGEYDYVNNRANVFRFWKDRVEDVYGQEIIYTLGMRGVHDGAMNGAKTIEEQKKVLETVFKDQRYLLSQYVNKDLTKVPQVFIPYKEVLDVYNANLNVPEDVTLMWCDDNYGYIRHFPTVAERKRKGGNGLYYHVSYWGRPHDYLWLGTFSPYLLYHQMKEAYHRGIQKMWILNVGDIKPAEYQIELFMDMAWNMEAVELKGVSHHLCNFLKREFDEETGKKLLPVMQEHYRMAYIRKPEFMGNTRTEERDPIYRIVKDLPWSESYIKHRLQIYRDLSDAVEDLDSRISFERKDAYFQLVKYPVQGAAQMNNKILYAQLARHGKINWQSSGMAYDSIVSLTALYNRGISNGGKWNYMMDHRPRKLEVFAPVKQEEIDVPMKEDIHPLYRWNGTDASGTYLLCEGLGYESKAINVARGDEIYYDFMCTETDSVEVEVRLLPNHPIEKQLRFTISVDGNESSPISYETQGRSEEWKMNVLRNQAVRKITLPLNKQSSHRLTFKALDEGVVVDQIYLFMINRSIPDV